MATFGSGSIHVVHRLDGLTNSGSSSSGACMIMAIRNNNMQQYEGFSLSCCDKRLWAFIYGRSELRERLSWYESRHEFIHPLWLWPSVNPYIKSFPPSLDSPRVWICELATCSYANGQRRLKP